MKKTLIALMALSMLSIGAAQAAEKRPVSNFLNKLEAKEEAAYKKIEADKKAAEARKKERAEQQKARQEALEKQKKEAQAQREARQKKIETKKQQWKDLLEIDK
ncbi:TPA: hypothetical protein IAC10_14475 [Candidatus Scatousia excrementigallinarum]|uniref:Uncharacterized protein n=1 Tax=Candidatus Scatousia excrementigallinarum TaxID=2840935 RepID=A0A9D1JP86_9BACT|nr:hypothetical protein [Candidatus Scatousia excrementigallinarum]